ncbi:transposable element Tcb2 transposase [Trichonephila clavipes]|nr:transposable element Tcb2 transposase [Trichonephila clavipes]
MKRWKLRKVGPQIRWLDNGENDIITGSKWWRAITPNRARCICLFETATLQDRDSKICKTETTRSIRQRQQLCKTETARSVRQRQQFCKTETATLPEEIGGRQREKTLDTRHRRLDDQYRVFTVARRLHGGGLFARRPVRRVTLTPVHRRSRSLLCREHRNSRDNEWGRVLFTDESRFSLSSDFHRILIWRERGSRNHPSNIIERDTYGGRGVLVWGDIMLGSRTDLHIFDAGSDNGTRYCNEILLPYVRHFRGAMGLQFLFKDDNAPCHRSVAAEQLLESEDIESMDWPARSSDLNPIEHVWDFLGRRLAARTLPPVTIGELRLALQDEWAAMPQQLIDTLILSMGRRCETILAVREIISPTKDRMFLAGHPSQGCFGLQSHVAPCYFFKLTSFDSSDFSFTTILIDGGKTAHSAFKLPLNLHHSESVNCNISKQSDTVHVIREAKLIIWDECTMAHKKGIEAINRTLQDIRGCNYIMVGLTVLLSGNFRQTLHVVLRGTRADIVKASLKT